MKQIVDKLNKIAKKIDESVEIPQTDLIIDSLDAITKAYGGTPNDSNLIVDKLEDIYNNISPAVSGNIEITENGENINVAPFATATVNVSGGGSDDLLRATVTLNKIETIDETERFIQFQGLMVSTHNGIKEANNRVAVTNVESTITYPAIIDTNAPQNVTIYDEDEAPITVLLSGAAEFIEEEPDGVQIEISGDCTISVTVHN